MKKKHYIYCDMDGVLADFNNEPNALERFKTEKGFFANLKPIKENVEAIANLLTNKNVKVRILSASPNTQADHDKRLWLKRHLPKLKANSIIICRVGDCKADFMKTKQGILFDDYGKNCIEWAMAKPFNLSYKITKDQNIAYYVNTKLG